MHEMAIVEDLIKLCEKNLEQNNAHKIKEIYIKVGRLSGVEPHYLQSCYDAFKVGTICNDAKLHIHLQEVIVQCFDCHFNGILAKNHFICPNCKSVNIKVVDGEDMYLMRLIME